MICTGTRKAPAWKKAAGGSNQLTHSVTSLVDTPADEADFIALVSQELTIVTNVVFQEANNQMNKICSYSSIV